MKAPTRAFSWLKVVMTRLKSSNIPCVVVGAAFNSHYFTGYESTKILEDGRFG